MIAYTTIIKTFPTPYSIGDLFRLKVRDMPIVTMNRKGIVTIKTFTKIRRYMSKAQVVKIDLEDGFSIICSPQTKLHKYQGGMIGANALKPNSTLLKIIEYQDYYKKIPIKIMNITHTNHKEDLYTGIVLEHIDQYCLANGTLVSSR